MGSRKQLLDHFWSGRLEDFSFPSEDVCQISIHAENVDESKGNPIIPAITNAMGRIQLHEKIMEISKVNKNTLNFLFPQNS